MQASEMMPPCHTGRNRPGVDFGTAKSAPTPWGSGHNFIFPTVIMRAMVAAYSPRSVRGTRMDPTPTDAGGKTLSMCVNCSRSCPPR